MLFIEKTLAKSLISPVSPTGQAVEWHEVRERVGSGEWGRWLLPVLWRTINLHIWVSDCLICGRFQTRFHVKRIFLTYNLLNHTSFFIEFCVGYIKGSIWMSPKANNQCRWHFARSLYCLLNDVADLGWAYRFPPTSFEEEDGNLARRWQPGKLGPLTSVITASMRRYRQQTGESLHPECSHKATGRLSSVESSPALGVHAPCDPLPCPTPSALSAQHWRSIFQQVSVQIHEGLINVARYGAQRSPVWAQQHWHRLLPVAEGDTGAVLQTGAVFVLVEVVALPEAQ